MAQGRLWQQKKRPHGFVIFLGVDNSTARFFSQNDSRELDLPIHEFLDGFKPKP